jgi:SAM-dependent methyltransferase
LESIWQTSALARSVIHSEAQLLHAALDDVFGLEMLQLGRWGEGRELMLESRTRHQSVAAQSPGAGVNVVARLAHLPIASAAVDAVLLPHALEFESDPHAVLREADRVLVGEGQLLVMGFRPAGPWGWRAAASRTGFPPGLRRVLSESRVRDWLVLLGYEIISVQRYLYSLPLDGNCEASLRRGWFYPFPAGAYLLKARKRLYGLTPIRPRKRERRALLGGALEPSA